jgi:hypothetical protein
MQLWHNLCDSVTWNDSHDDTIQTPDKGGSEMKRTETIFALFYTVAVTCSFLGWGQPEHHYPFCPGYDPKQAVSQRIPSPDGYTRIELSPDGGYSDWVRHLPLKPEGSPVLSWQGDTLFVAGEVIAVIDLDIPNRLYQCADVAMRLWAEFLWSRNRQEDIRYRTSAGSDLSWSGWLEERGAEPSRKLLLQYLNTVMASCNTSSLARDISKVAKGKILPGDMYIQPDPSGRGGIGHLSIVFDTAINERGESVYLFGFGYMPAQDVHVVRPEAGQGIGAWFTREGYQEYSSVWGRGSFFRFQ